MISVDIHRWPGWVLEMVGIEPGEIPTDAEAWVSFRRFPESGWGLLSVLLLFLGFAYVGWVYRREASLSRRRKVVFAGLRSAVVLTIALVLFSPALEVSVERSQRAVTLVLVDDSLSFSVADAYRSNPVLRNAVAKSAGVEPAALSGLTRARIARRLLEDEKARLLPRLAENNLLKLFRFSEKLQPLDSDSRGEGEEPRGLVTDLGGSVRTAVESQGSTPVAAVVVISDGKATAGEDPGGIARHLAEREVPVYTIGIGDPSPTRNIRLTAVAAPERVFKGDPLVVDVRLAHRGFEGESVDVELLATRITAEDGAGVQEGSAKSLGQVQTPFDASPETTARFRTQLKDVGRYRLLARVKPLEDETFANDNERSVNIEVIEQATRVLVVAGAPTNEFRALKNFLRRDRRTHLDAWLMSADIDAPQEGNSVLKKLPATSETLFKYDVVILMDINPAGLPPGFLQLLTRFVGQHRGGFAYVAGEKYTGRLLRHADYQALHDLLAVEFDKSLLQDEFARGRYHKKEWPLGATFEALAHASTRLSSDPERNKERWAELPGVYWSVPVRRTKPGAAVLLEHSNPRFIVDGVKRPLLAYQFYEGGRSAFLSFDETWRWRALSEEIYDQFWMQLVRALTEGRLLGDRRQMVITDRDSYDLGDVMRITAMLQDEEYRPVARDSLTVEVSSSAEESVPEEVILEADPTQAGWYRGVYLPRNIGSHRIRIPEGAEKLIEVNVPELEFQDPRLEQATLKDLSRLSGGEYFPMDRFAEIPDKIPDRSRTVVVTDEPRPLWDNALVLGWVVLLLSAEWILRKWSRLP